MELLRPEDRQRLLNLRNVSTKATPPASHDVSLPAGPLASSGLQQEALAAWRGMQTSSQTFRPFEKNSSKQARYELYLNRLRQGDKGWLLHVPSCIVADTSQYFIAAHVEVSHFTTPPYKYSPVCFCSSQVRFIRNVSLNL